MLGFHENLVGIGPICDTKYSVLFTEDAVHILNPTGTVVLTGWREDTGHRLWRMSLLPDEECIKLLSGTHNVQRASLATFSVYDLPTVHLVRNVHFFGGELNARRPSEIA
mgnify:CR=1 FL=1